MPLIQSFDPGGEKFLGFAKKKIRELHEYMARSGLAVFNKRIDVSDGMAIYINSVYLGQGQFKDRIRITGGEQFYWEEQYPEQDLWSLPSAVRPQFAGDTSLLPIQHVAYSYIVSDTRLNEAKHDLVICRYCQRVAEFSWNETAAYGTNLEVIGSVFISNTVNTVMIGLPAPNEGQTRIIFGEYVPGSGQEDPGVAGRIIPVMIKRSDVPVTVSTALVDGVSDGDGGFSGGLYYFRLVSRDDTQGIAVVMPPTVQAVDGVGITFRKNVTRIGEYYSHDGTNATVYDYNDNGTRTTRTLPHGLRAQETASTWGRLGEAAPDWNDYQTTYLNYGNTAKGAQWGSPGPALFQGLTWTGPGGTGGGAGTEVFYFAAANEPHWVTGTLTVYEEDSTTIYYLGGAIGGSGELYTIPDPAGEAFQAAYAAWEVQQLILLREVWAYIMEEMDRKRFCPTAILAELRPHPTKQFDKLLVFPVKSRAVFDIKRTSDAASMGALVWNSSYQRTDFLLEWAGFSLVMPADAGPVPAWTYTVMQPCLFTWSVIDRAFTLSSSPPAYQKYYFSFGKIDFSGYRQRPYFGLYRVKGVPPTTGLYQYDQATNDAQMRVVCLVSGSLAYAAYSNLYTPLRGSYWRRSQHTIVDSPYSVVQLDIENTDNDSLAPA